MKKVGRALESIIASCLHLSPMKLSVFFNLFLFASIAFAQEVKFRDDTVNVESSKLQSDTSFSDLPYFELSGFHHYRPYGTNRLPLSRLGNNGLPVHSHRILPQDWDIDANLGGYNAYLMKKGNLKLYKASRPFTILNYTNGAEAEQLFSVLHTQNLGEGLNLSLEYRRTVSEGFFQNQLTSHTQFNSTFHLHSRNKKYRLIGYFYINDLESQENGGVNIIDQEEEDAILQEVNLNNAQNQSRSLGFGLKNAFNVWELDSNSTLLNFSHELDWARSYRLFKDQIEPDQSQYNSFFIDSAATADSSFAEVWKNALQFNFFNEAIRLGFRNEYYQYFQNFILDEHFSSNFITLKVEGSLYGNIQVNSLFEKGISGFHKEEMDWVTEMKFEEFKGIQSQLLLSIKEKQADFFVQNQRTNQHFFKGDFETSNTVSVRYLAEIEKYNLQLEGGFMQLDGFVYYDSSLTAKQLSRDFSTFYLKLNHKLNFFKHWNLRNRIQIQDIGEESVLPLASLFSYHSFYFENSFFNQALTIQSGFDLYYLSEFGGYAYSPSLAQFYVSESSFNSNLGGSGQLDFFLNLRIEKAARLFFKVENILNDQFSEDNLRVQNYPIPVRAFKVGLSWRMIN